MICWHKLYHFTVANTRFTAPLTRRGKTKFANLKWYNLCQQIIQSQTCYSLIKKSHCRQEGKRRRKARLKHPISRQASFVGPTVTKANLLDYSLPSIDPYGYGGFSLPHNNSFRYREQMHDASFLTAPTGHLSVSNPSDDSFYYANDKDEVFWGVQGQGVPNVCRDQVFWMLTEKRVFLLLEGK